MLIVITPAKVMKRDNAFLPFATLPQRLKDTQLILDYLKTLEVNQVKKMLKCNDHIALDTYRNYQMMELTTNLVPAILAYDGIQYQNMGCNIFSDDDFDYASKHVRILSGFYGVLRAMDGVVPYRLELNNDIKMDGYNNLAAFWNRKMYDDLVKDDHVILDLGAKQYTRMITKYRTAKVNYVKCYFKEAINGELKEIGVYVKIARGKMCQYLIKNKINLLEEVKQFNELGYYFNQDLSNEENYVFVRKKAVI